MTTRQIPGKASNEIIEPASQRSPVNLSAHVQRVELTSCLQLPPFLQNTTEQLTASVISNLNMFHCVLENV